MRVKDVAKIKNVTEQSVRRWIKLGMLNATFDTIGYLISPSDFTAFENKMEEYKKFKSSVSKADLIFQLLDNGNSLKII